MKIIFSPLGTVTAKFGEIGKSHPRPHTGIDYACPVGTPIHSPVEGYVSHLVTNDRLGNGVYIKTDEGYQYIFGHLSEFKVKVGEFVSKGEVIALSGNTGHSTGAHLHFAVMDHAGRYIDPNSLLEKVAGAFTLWKSHAVNLFSSIVDNAILV
jgi:murein DD-endopeptidase MepM/ murein hydrolase activator NlpD